MSSKLFQREKENELTEILPTSSMTWSRLGILEMGQIIMSLLVWICMNYIDISRSDTELQNHCQIIAPIMIQTSGNSGLEYVYTYVKVKLISILMGSVTNEKFKMHYAESLLS